MSLICEWNSIQSSKYIPNVEPIWSEGLSNLELTSWGNPIKKIECFEPINVTMYPNERFPAKAPSDSKAPIHDVCSTVIGPVFNGLLSDCSNGRAIESQLIPPPQATNTKCAVRRKCFFMNTTFDGVWTTMLKRCYDNITWYWCEILSFGLFIFCHLRFCWKELSLKYPEKCKL